MNAHQDFTTAVSVEFVQTKMDHMDVTAKMDILEMASRVQVNKIKWQLNIMQHDSPDFLPIVSVYLKGVLVQIYK